MAALTKQSRYVTIVNEYGMHARPSAVFVKLAARYESELMVEKNGVRVSGKSIIGLMTLQASCGTILKLTAEGTDAKEMLDVLVALVENKFEDG